MRPRLLVAVAEGVVADRGRGVEALLDVAGLDEAALLGGVAPDAGVAVGLELEPDGQLVGLLGAGALLRLAHLVAGAEQVLHVVPELVGEDVDAGEVARRVELALRAA